MGARVLGFKEILKELQMSMDLRLQVEVAERPKTRTKIRIRTCKVRLPGENCFDFLCYLQGYIIWCSTFFFLNNKKNKLIFLNEEDFDHL